METVLTTLTSSQILNLRTTPIEVIPAQGSGFFVVPIAVILRVHPGTTPYGTLTTSLGLLVNGVSLSPLSMSTAFLGASSDTFIYYTIGNSNNSPGLNTANCDNQGVSIKNTGLLDLTSGNGTMDVQIDFDLVNV